MGDWNHLKVEILQLMEELPATRLPTDPSYSAVRNGNASYNDLVFYKGLDVHLTEQIQRGAGSSSDHDGFLITINNASTAKGQTR